MSVNKIYEEDVENTIISLLQKNNYEFIDENDNWLKTRKYSDFINKELLLKSLRKFNNYSDDVLKEAIDRILKIDDISLFEKNFRFHKLLIDGISIDSKKYKVNPLVKLIDFDNVENNTFQVCHQIRFNEGFSNNNRIPDIVIFVNGIPIVVMELKSFDEDATEATLETAYLQLGGCDESSGYRYDIPTLFNFNAFLVISDGVTSKVGTITSKFNRFNEWKSVSGEKGYDDNCVNKLNVLIDGLFEHKRLLDVIKNNIFFIQDKNDKPIKIMTQYHQYFGVNRALNSIIQHIKPSGDGKAGIIWHTQGSGKSFSMVMLAHRLLIDKRLNVPTIVVLTDRIDLDDQLYKTFYSARDYLKCEPIIAESRTDLVRKLGKLKQGGVILTTIGKFDKDNLPKNERNNIIVMSDEAHRSHYGLYEQVRYLKNDDSDELEASFKYGIEKYIREALSNATYIGFTGTPVSTAEKQTTDIYGDIIDTYDMTQSVIDGSTVKLFYESRLAKVVTDDSVLKKIDEYYNNLEEQGLVSKDAIDKSKKEMSKLKIILEDDDLIEKFAKDILSHYEERKTFLNGKAMIVCQTRVAAKKLYYKMIELKPEYKDKIILVVTESNKDDEESRKLFRDSSYRKELGEEFKKDNSKYKIAIVVDMWLTGFDVPDLDVMYFIKRLKAHNLMQAIARVNRVYPGKQSGLIVDYIGLNKDLDSALSQYTDRDRKENVLNIKNEIYKILKEKLEILNHMFRKVDKTKFFSAISKDRFSTIQDGAKFVLETKKREDLFLKDLSISIKQAFAACAGITTDEEKNDIYYYLAIRSYILKLRTNTGIVSIKDMNKYVSELLQDALKGDEVKVLTKTEDETINVIELLTPERIKELRENHPVYIFIEIIHKLLERAIIESRKNNLLKAQEYSKRLKEILAQYNSRDELFVPEQYIVKLIPFAKEIVDDEKEAQTLSPIERAFYDILIKNKTPRELLQDETLKQIAKELKQTVDEYSSYTDWKEKEATRAKMRNEIRECLRRHNYQNLNEATDAIFNQAELID